MITNKKFNPRQLKIKAYNVSKIPEIKNVLKDFDTSSLIIRPDRFVLGSTDKNDLKNFVESYLNEIYIS